MRSTQLKMTIEDTLDNGLPRAYTAEPYNQKCSAVAEFNESVFVVTYRLKQAPLSAFANRERIPFKSPLYGNKVWLFRALDGMTDYLRAPLEPVSPWNGILIDGVWQAIGQTNGMAKGVNPVKFDVVCDMLRANIAQALLPLL